MANSIIEDFIKEPSNKGFNNSKKPKEKKKKSKIKIIIIFLLLIVVICVAVIAYLQLNETSSTVTVSSKDGFFNTFSSSNIEELSDSDLYSELFSKISSENNSTNTNILVDYSGEDFSISNINLNLDSLNDIENSKYYTDAVLSYSDNDLFELEVLASESSIGLKSDEIITSYLGASYDYLAEWGAEEYDENNINGINIYLDNLEDIKSFLESVQNLSGLKNSLETYENVFRENLDESHFSSQDVTLNMEYGTFEATEYTLTMTQSEIINILKEILEKFETDTESITLVSNVIEIFGITESGLISYVDEGINQLENYDTGSTEQVIVKTYDSDGKTIKLSVEYSDYIVEIEFGYEDNGNSMKITSVELDSNNSEEGVSFEITNTKSDLTEQFNMEVSLIEDSSIVETYTASTKLVKSGNTYALTGTLDFTQSETTEDSTTSSESSIDKLQSEIANYNLKVSLESEIDFSSSDIEVEDLTTENCVFLDDITEEERDSTLQSIYEALTEVITEKMSQLSFIDTNSGSVLVEQNTDEDDETDKEEAMNDLISAIQEEMTIANDNGEEYTIQDLDGIEVEGHEVETEISSDLAVVTVDGYVFNIDSDFNLSE